MIYCDINIRRKNRLKNTKNAKGMWQNQSKKMIMTNTSKKLKNYRIKNGGKICWEIGYSSKESEIYVFW